MDVGFPGCMPLPPRRPIVFFDPLNAQPGLAPQHQNPWRTAGTRSIQFHGRFHFPSTGLDAGFPTHPIGQAMPSFGPSSRISLLRPTDFVSPGALLYSYLYFVLLNKTAAKNSPRDVAFAKKKKGPRVPGFSGFCGVSICHSATTDKTADESRSWLGFGMKECKSTNRTASHQDTVHLTQSTVTRCVLYVCLRSSISQAYLPHAR
ncbi:hypothetical protein QBC35DRAFT_88942 [Podospora australis]|uniref:Uncharacterized protein n=1 Tax=Podospora australis TaxID=1536484 RepID=A0AAN6WXZ0_9PEZI|nr:hypothetical protein QBC35DRAFT_88942 [Podospora australis]